MIRKPGPDDPRVQGECVKMRRSGLKSLQDPADTQCMSKGLHNTVPWTGDHHEDRFH